MRRRKHEQACDGRHKEARRPPASTGDCDRRAPVGPPPSHASDEMKEDFVGCYSDGDSHHEDHGGGEQDLRQVRQERRHRFSSYRTAGRTTLEGAKPKAMTKMNSPQTTAYSPISP